MLFTKYLFTARCPRYLNSFFFGLPFYENIFCLKKFSLVSTINIKVLCLYYINFLGLLDKFIFCSFPIKKLHSYTGLPHTQGIQRIFKLKKISGNFDLFFKLREVLKFKKSQDIFLLYLEWDLINLVQYFVQEIHFI